MAYGKLTVQYDSVQVMIYHLEGVLVNIAGTLVVVHDQWLTNHPKEKCLYNG